MHTWGKFWRGQWIVVVGQHCTRTCRGCDLASYYCSGQLRWNIAPLCTPALFCEHEFVGKNIGGNKKPRRLVSKLRNETLVGYTTLLLLFVWRKLEFFLLNVSRGGTRLHWFGFISESVLFLHYNTDYAVRQIVSKHTSEFPLKSILTENYKDLFGVMNIR